MYGILYSLYMHVSSFYFSIGTVVDRDILASTLYLGEVTVAIVQRYIFMHTRYDRDVT